MSTVTVALRQAGGRGDKAGSHDTVVPMGEESVLPAAQYSLCPRRSMARLTTSGKPPSSVTPSARHYARIKDTRCSRAGIDTGRVTDRNAETDWDSHDPNFRWNGFDRSTESERDQSCRLRQVPPQSAVAFRPTTPFCVGHSDSSPNTFANLLEARKDQLVTRSRALHSNR